MVVQAQVVLVSAIASGQGKTTVTAALARALTRQGKRVRVFKTGPDFIDPMILERASGAPVFSLDLWMVGLEASRALLAQAAQESDVILIEGVMGLYDGTPSSADLARAFGVPVLAVVDASAMAQTVGAVVMGLRDFGPVDLIGVVANKIASSGHAQMVSDALSTIPLLASFPRQEAHLPERHLGLVLPDEVAQIDALLDAYAQTLMFDSRAWDAMAEISFEASCTDSPLPRLLDNRRIAIARDAAFAFIYPANLQCLRDMGAVLLFFSPLANEAVPADADAVYLPGGYPELHAQVLSQAEAWQSSIQQCNARGIPIWAECGGMMALSAELIDLEEKTWTMAGIFSGQAIMQKRLAALGPYVWSFPQGGLRGHSFHYSRFETALLPCAEVEKYSPSLRPDSPKPKGEAVYQVGSCRGSYFHAYFPSNPKAAAQLFMREPV